MYFDNKKTIEKWLRTALSQIMFAFFNFYGHTVELQLSELQLSIHFNQLNTLNLIIACANTKNCLPFLSALKFILYGVQLYKHFSYPNTSQSQRIWMTGSPIDFLVAYFTIVHPLSNLMQTLRNNRNNNHFSHF